MRLLLMRISYLPITRLTVHAAARLMLLLAIWKPILLDFSFLHQDAIL